MPFNSTEFSDFAYIIKAIFKIALKYLKAIFRFTLKYLSVYRSQSKHVMFIPVHIIIIDTIFSLADKTVVSYLPIKMQMLKKYSP